MEDFREGWRTYRMPELLWIAAGPWGAKYNWPQASGAFPVGRFVRMARWQRARRIELHPPMLRFWLCIRATP